MLPASIGAGLSFFGGVFVDVFWGVAWVVALAATLLLLFLPKVPVLDKLFSRFWNWIKSKRSG